MKKDRYTIILFYKFFTVKNPERLRDQQKKLCETFGLRGRMLIAKEGVNATFEGTTQQVKSYIRYQKKTRAFKNVVFKESEGMGKAFTKLMVKIRPEIVTLGVGELNIKKETAPVVTAHQLEAMYQRKEDFVVLDLRNDFEVQAGYFENTVNPNLKNFRDLPKKISELSHLKNKKTVAVCTGGIRCEKATVLLRQQGFSHLYQLKDGIHTYIKKYPGKHFKGSLFVFDNRMTTPIVETKKREVVGKCFFCDAPCEEFYNDDSVRPSRKLLCCSACIMRHEHRLRRCIPA